MAKLVKTPSGERTHIGIFGKTNSGKSSFINAFTNQDISIVSNEPGTTTDPVYKAMEINPIGPCMLIDTAGLSDGTSLENERLKKTKDVMQKCDVAIVIFDSTSTSDKADEEFRLIEKFQNEKLPVIVVLNKVDITLGNFVAGTNVEADDIIKNSAEMTNWVKIIKERSGIEPILVSASNRINIDKVKQAIMDLNDDLEEKTITGDLVEDGDLVLLIMPQDIQAPKGRLILPQVETIRELLDKKCIVVSATTDKMVNTLEKLANPPKLIITDSQVFDYVYEHKPSQSKLTSFSVLFAGYKGDITYYTDSVSAIERLTENSKVLIAECCTHAPLSEDIGREKIPKMLRNRVGQNLTIDMVSGSDFPEDLKPYDLIIQCGGCMFNRAHVVSRINKARLANVPMTNYGTCIAYLTGILDKVAFP